MNIEDIEVVCDIHDCELDWDYVDDVILVSHCDFCMQEAFTEGKRQAEKTQLVCDQ